MRTAGASRNAAFSFGYDRTGPYPGTSAGKRPLVLALIIGLHAGVLLYATIFRPSGITPPKLENVVMAQLIAEPTMQQPITPPVQAVPPVPVSKPPTPPMLKPVAKPVVKPVEKPTVKPVVKSRPEPAPEVTNDSAPAAPSPPEAAPPPVAAAVPATPAPAAPPAAAPVLSITPPRFNAAYLNNPPPAYPPMARRMGEEGKVMLRVFVTPEGTAGDVRVQTSSGSPVFDEAALEAVRQWRFVPARQGESSVAAWVQVPIVFKLG